ncbi:MAG: GAF domain-containing protein [Tateyamaria sp.]|uniref:GAF domain-containing protein n=2 Tax=Tateyamaria sp. TaxID=1929288 RepID=UPI0032711123
MRTQVKNKNVDQADHSNDISNMAEFDALAQSITAKLNCEMSLISIVNADALVALGYSGDDLAVTGRSFQLRDTICSKTVQVGRPLRIADAQIDPMICDMPAVVAHGIGAYIGAPLRLDGYGVIGAVCAVSKSARLWQDGEVDYLIAVGDLVESKIERQLLRYEQKALSDALAESDAILTMLSELEGKPLTVHNEAGDLVFANSAVRTDLRLNTHEVLSLSKVASGLIPEVTQNGGVDVALPVPGQTELNVHVSAIQNGLTLAQWARTDSELDSN